MQSCKYSPLWLKYSISSREVQTYDKVSGSVKGGYRRAIAFPEKSLARPLAHPEIV